ncbi:MAG TPA: GntR family transcriptional regulator [Steroidobacteraceae bacterium]|nr:GntR family transcriptional regulator [Steroidobacteraceae bacterium]
MDTQLARATVSVREMILRGRLKPGQRVTEVMLAELLGMSRTPVRQALPVLAREGLLVESGTRGYLVRTFTRNDILDAIDLRGVLEGFAVRRIAERGASAALLAQLGQCLEEGDQIFRKRHLVDSDEAAYGAMNDRFHAALLAEADSPVIAGALASNDCIPFASAGAIAFDATDLQAMFDALHFAHMQHHAIRDALAAGQSVRAEFLMCEHVNTVKSSINMLDIRDADPEQASGLRLIRS